MVIKLATVLYFRKFYSLTFAFAPSFAFAPRESILSACFSKPGMCTDDRYSRQSSVSSSNGNARAFPFELETLDWREYLSSVHIPGLLKHALRIDSRGAKAKEGAKANVRE